MSKEKRFIEITPGKLSPGGRMIEVIESSKFAARNLKRV